MRTLTLTFASVITVASCSTSPPVNPVESRIVTGSPDFCEVANNKSAYIGKPLKLSGTYETDLRHYSMLSAICDGKDVGFALGYGPSPISWKDPVILNRCAIACRIEVKATVTGTLVRREGGIDLDFVEILVPEDLTQ